MQKNQVLSDFKTKLLQPVRFWNKNLTTRQILQKNVFSKSMILEKKNFKKHDYEEEILFKKHDLEW